MSPSTIPGRRRLLGAGAAGALAAFLGTGGRALATVEDMERAIARFGGGGAPQAGGIALELPDIAENGRSVAVAFEVESPMSETDHVEAVLLLAPENPTTEVATFRFTPASGAAKAATRMRLAQTQDVIAVAKMSDGSFLRASNEVKVTIGGCGG